MRGKNNQKLKLNTCEGLRCPRPNVLMLNNYISIQKLMLFENLKFNYFYFSFGRIHFDIIMKWSAAEPQSMAGSQH